LKKDPISAFRNSKDKGKLNDPKKKKRQNVSKKPTPTFLNLICGSCAILGHKHTNNARMGI
jgi:hypothetical protein